MNNQLVDTRPVSLLCATEVMTLPEALAWAREHVAPGTGWLLAESPRGVAWNRFSGEALPGDAAEIERLAIFGPDAELRLEKAFGAASGPARLLRVDEAGEPTFERLSRYPLANGMRLAYAEHFREDEKSGVLRLAWARFCGVTEGGD
ncbi:MULTISPECIES: hypothetical protein [unclassified Desulfovibrio]|uniref:hypothetical protein n=1 Tax=unclassified Desulfovibrio TaxID=2593640 RepID=UPI0013EE297C|nr:MULTISPECIES: hypothetical protein [unclassified Desulfovibrio]